MDFPGVVAPCIVSRYLCRSSQIPDQGFDAARKRLRGYNICMGVASFIDGYNLLHALGLARRHFADGELAEARRRLLALLHARLDPGDEVTVVFDARRRPRRAAPEEWHERIHVVYAVQQEADDWIEALLARHPGAAQLHVVSSDQRIQRAARQARAQALGCQEFLDHLERRPSRTPHAAGDDSKPEIPPVADDDWQRHFGDIVIPKELRDSFDDE
jgi:predicted RNA-binding protein with PIN domain